MAFNNNNVLSVPMTLAPSSLTHAIAFLTRPLVLALAPAALARLQSALRTALEAAYIPNRASRLVLAFAGPTCQLPPRPVHAACLAAGVPWAGWMQLLVARRFDLVIEPRVVLVEYPSAGFIPAQTVVVWSEASSVPRRSAPLLAATTTPAAAAAATADAAEQHVPISKSRVQASLRATLHSAIARSQTRTLAQQLLAVEEKKEADELFAMIYTSGCAGVLSPTPTREGFPVGISMAAAASPMFSFAPSANDDKQSSPLSSRPSSRSSTVSTFSIYDSDEESVTSASSASSFDFLDSTKPTSTTTTSIPTITITPVPAFARRVPAPAPFVPRQRQQQQQQTTRAAPTTTIHTAVHTAASIQAPTPASPFASAAAAPRVFIDNTKKDVTKYLYQGGVSTVLTGGVMLGGGKKAAAPTPKTPAAPAPTFKVAAAPAPTPKAAAAAAPQVPKYRAPIGSGRWGPPAVVYTPKALSASANSWRRPAARV